MRSLFIIEIKSSDKNMFIGIYQVFFLVGDKRLRVLWKTLNRTLILVESNNVKESETFKKCTHVVR